jgi:hypothetical protein
MKRSILLHRAARTFLGGHDAYPADREPDNPKKGKCYLIQLWWSAYSTFCSKTFSWVSYSSTTRPPLSQFLKILTKFKLHFLLSAMTPRTLQLGLNCNQMKCKFNKFLLLSLLPPGFRGSQFGPRQDLNGREVYRQNLLLVVKEQRESYSQERVNGWASNILSSSTHHGAR